MKKILQISILTLLAITYLMIALSYATPTCTLLGAACSTAYTCDTCDAADTSLTEVQAAVNLTARGGTVNIPAGASSWSSALTIDRAIRLKGAGAGSDATCDGTETCITSTNTTATSYYTSDYATTPDCGLSKETTNYKPPILVYKVRDASADENVVFEISGIMFYQSASLTDIGGLLLINGDVETPIRKVLIHDNRFQYRTDSSTSQWNQVFNVHGDVWGVIYKNTMNVRKPYINVYGSRMDNDGGVDGICYYGTSVRPGKQTWDEKTYTPGTKDILFFEDNTWNFTLTTNEHMGGSSTGGKGFVSRYNTFNNSDQYARGQSAFDLHGAYNSPGTYPPMGFEVYGNLFQGASLCTVGNAESGCSGGVYSAKILVARAGRVIAFNNLTKNSGGDKTLNPSAVQLNHECNECIAGHDAPTDFACPAGVCGGLNRCSGETLAADRQPPHVFNSYIFQNRYGEAGTSLGTVLPIGGTGTPTLCYNSQVGWKPIENTEWWKDNSNCSGANCTSGVGCGTTLPTCTGTCNAGVGFWLTSTDSCTTLTTSNVGAGGTPATKIRQGTLYVRKNNQWVAYYTPYIYPHDLRDDVPADTTAPSITGLSPTTEQVCDDLDDTEDITVSLVATDQTQASVACYYDTETRADYAALAASGHELSASGTTFSATAAGLACATTHTIWYGCTDGTTATSVGTYQFTIAARGDTGEATVTNNTSTNQACAAFQRIAISTNKPATAKFCKAGEVIGEGVCDADTSYADMPHTFSTTGGETGHVAHSTDVSQSCSETIPYYVRTETTQGVANTSSTAVTITTDAAKTVTISGSGMTITIGSGANQITIIP
jgi:hypothetical protein